jgi:hypothetical protein
MTTTQHIKDKIERVYKDIELMRTNGAALDRIQVLSEYVDYLQDELKQVLDDEKQQNSSKLG